MNKILTKEQWVEIINNPEIISDLGLKIFITLFEFDNHQAYASELGMKLGFKGKSPQSPLNSEIGRFGKRIAKFYDVDLTIRENQTFKFWDIFFLGEDVGTMFLWKLRPELVEAIKELNIHSNGQNQQKIARICWNYYNWTKPSGKEGKSLNKNSYEYQTGFGHEEWLFDFEKQIDGFHYAFLQPINANWELYQNDIFDIHLYSIDNSTKKRWWLGKIKNVQIISKDEAQNIYSIYKRNGWIKEMVEQLKIIDADYEKILNTNQNIFNIKFKISDCDEILDIPLLISENDASIKATYYTTLINKISEPELEHVGSFNFSAKHNPQTRYTIANYGQRQSEIDRLHPKIQDYCYDQLVSEFGKPNVGTEISTGFGTSIDIVVNKDSNYIFYEIKTNKSIRLCIREAVSQLLEYAYYPDKCNSNKLIIVSQNKIDNETKKYLQNLRTQFGIPIFYQQFDLDTNRLLKDEF